MQIDGVAAVQEGGGSANEQREGGEAATEAAGTKADGLNDTTARKEEANCTESKSSGGWAPPVKKLRKTA